MKYILIIFLSLFLVGCSRTIDTPHNLGERTQTIGCTFNNWPYPDYACSPGSIIPNATKEVICVNGYTQTVRNVPEVEKEQVYAEYGIINHPAYSYEVDHIISLELGGDNSIANLWPEKYDDTYGARIKDKAENNLHAKVCSGQMTLVEAQYQIAHNWTAWIK